MGRNRIGAVRLTLLFDFFVGWPNLIEPYDPKIGAHQIGIQNLCFRHLQPELELFGIVCELMFDIDLYEYSVL
jgi:hypothetical protein